MCELLAKLEALERHVAELEELIRGERQKDAALPPEWLTARQAAEMTGLTVPTIRAYCERRVITHSTAGRRLLVNRASLEEYINDNAKLSTKARLNTYKNQWSKRSI